MPTFVLPSRGAMPVGTHPLADRLESCWLFQEQAGLVAKDSMGRHSIDFAGLSQLGWTQTGAFPGAGFQSKAPGSTTDAGTLTGFPTLATAWTIEAWLRLDGSNDGYGTICAVDGDTGLYIRQSGGIHRINFYLSGDHNSAVILGQDRHYHVVITYSNPLLSIYVDTRLDSQYSISGISFSPTKILNDTNTETFIGTLSLLRIWRQRCLNAGEVGQLNAAPFAMFGMGRRMVRVAGQIAQRTLTGSVTPTGTVAFVPSGLLTGSTTPTGALQRLVHQSLSGSVAPVGTLTQGGLMTHALSGAVPPSGALIRAVHRTLSGTVMPTGTVFLGGAAVIAFTLDSIDVAIDASVSLLPATATWLAAARHPEALAGTGAFYAPVYVVFFRSLTFETSLTQAVYFLSGPVTSMPTSGIQRLQWLAPLEQGGIGAVQHQLDEQTLTARLSGCSVAIIPIDGLVALLEAGPVLNVPVQVYMGFEGLPFDQFVTIFYGTLDRYEVLYEHVNFALVDGTIREAINLSTPLGLQYFPGTPQAFRSQSIPLVVGAARNIPLIPVVYGAVVGTLAQAMDTASLTIVLNEIGLNFPTAGQVLIGSETILYAGRRITNILGKSYLELNTLTRSAPAAHALAASVARSNLGITVFLVGYGASTVNEVQNAGVIVDPGNYAVSTTTADRLVTIVTLNFAPADPSKVTATLNAASLDQTNLLTNGGFEAGDASGWTVEAGGTLTAGTSSPTPLDGVYRGALTGGLSTLKRAYQDVTTVPGETYTYSLAYQNQTNPSILSNASFETGSLSSWSTRNNTRALAAVITGGTDGLKVLKASYTDPVFTTQSYTVDVSQDFTTSVGVTYTFTFQYRTQRNDDTAIFFAMSYPVEESSLKYTVGTPGSEQLYVALTTLGPSHSYINNSPTFAPETPEMATSPSHTFVATTTTTRVVFTLAGRTYLFNSAIPAGQYADGHAVFLPMPTLLDAVNVHIGSASDTSSATLQVGIAASPGLYHDGALPVSTNWQTINGTFVPGSATTRFSVLSQYALTSFATFLDAATINAGFSFAQNTGGQNPIDALLYLLNTFRGTALRYNVANFATAHSLLSHWKFGAYLTSPGDLDTLLQRLAFECGALLTRDALGQYDVIVLDNSRAVTFAASDALNIVEGTFARTSSPNDAVYTAFYVYYGAKTGGSTSVSDFAGVTYATRTETSHPSGAQLVAQCAAAFALTHKERRYDVYATWVQDFATACLLLERLVARFSAPYDVLDFHTFLDAIPLSLGQMLTVGHPLLPQDGRPVNAEVIGWQHTPGETTLHLTARVLQPASLAPPVASPITLQTAKNVPIFFDITPYVSASSGTAIDWGSLDLDGDVGGAQSSKILAAIGAYVAIGNGDTSFTPVTDYLGAAVTTYAVRDTLGQESNRATITVTVTESAAPVLTRSVSGSVTPSGALTHTIIPPGSGMAPVAQTIIVDMSPDVSRRQFSFESFVTPDTGATINWATLVITPEEFDTNEPSPQYIGSWDDDPDSEEPFDFQWTVGISLAEDITGDGLLISTYHVEDDQARVSNTAQIIIRLQRPIASDITIDGLANDSDPVVFSLADSVLPLAGRTITWSTLDIAPLTFAGQGELTIGSGGSVTFTPDPAYVGDALDADYTVEDNTTAVSNTATIHITSL